MEHRNGKRIPIYLNVFLHQGGRKLGWYTTRDLGTGGIALRGNIRDLDNNTLVGIEIERGRKHAIGPLHLKGLVVHQDAGSIGFMWANQEEDISRLLEAESGSSGGMRVYYLPASNWQRHQQLPEREAK